ncbi:family 16 glycosylhydrolase [bacterium]|jgi:beta-glucanase (GH16 family)|nr:family 16 glycosylhydrolase [bacterium]
MKSLIFTIKYMLYEIQTFFLNIFYYLRYFYYIETGKFDKDYSSNKNKTGYNLVFNDDFDDVNINWNNWNRWYSTPDSVSDINTANYIPEIDCLNINNGILEMSVNKNTNTLYPNIKYKAGNLYTSGNYTQNYGWFEICCKVPAKGRMFWPCFWLWGNSWPPEIDIFEFMDKDDVNTNHTNSMTMSLHWGLDNKINKSKYFSSQIMKTLKSFLKIKLNFEEHYHTMAIDWNPEYVDFYLDDIKIYRAIYFIPSNKMGIAAGVSVSDKNIIPKDEDLPAYYYIDYIRCYEKLKN